MRQLRFSIPAGWLAVALLLAAASAPAVTFSAGLDRSQITLGESAVLTLRFDGGQPDEIPQPPAVEHLRIAYQAQEQNISIINGRQSVALLLKYLVTPLEAKDYTIPQFFVKVGGGRLPTSPMVLKVAPRTAPAADPMGQLAFVRLHTSKPEVYVGEPFLVEAQLHFTEGRDIQMPSFPADGFTLGEVKHRQTRGVENGRQYHVVVFNTVATPVKTGRLKIGPVACRFTLMIPQQQRDFFGFARYSVRAVEPVSAPVEVNVLPLPTNNVPAGFNGALGTYTLAVEVSPTNVAVGDPITLKIQIEGQGPLENLPAPALEGWKDFKAYPPSSNVRIVDPLQMRGVKLFEQVVVPQRADLPQLPELTFTFFDPAQREYRTVRHAPVPLTVRPAASSSQPVFMLAQTNPPAGASRVSTELLHIKPHLGVVVPPGAGLHPAPGVWSLPAAAFVAWAVLLVRRRREEALANNPRRRRRLETNRREGEGLIELRRQAVAGEGGGFFATLFRLLQERLGERLDLPASAITEQVLDDRPAAFGSEAALREDLRRLFQACDEARYAPETRATELVKLAGEAAGVLARLKTLEAGGS